MKDLRKLKQARYYMRAMSEGVNPCTGEFAEENDVITQQSVQEYCEYVMTILEKIIERESCIGTHNDVDIENECMKGSPSGIIEISDHPIGVNELARRINAVLGDNVNKLCGYHINDWIVKKGYLDVVEINGHLRKKTNEMSGSIGLIGIKSDTSMREKILYTKEAQEYVVKNLGYILRPRKSDDKEIRRAIFWKNKNKRGK